MSIKQILLVIGCAAIGLVPTAALACSCPTHQYNYFQVGSSGVLPANAYGVPWLKSYDSVLSVVQVIGSTETPVDYTVEQLDNSFINLVRPTNWAQGNQYRIQARAAKADIKVGDNVELRSPKLSASSTVVDSLWVTSSSCSMEVKAAYVDVAMNLGLDPDDYFFKTYVDGRQWNTSSDSCTRVPPGESWVGRGTDRIMALCVEDEGFGGLSTGPHTVRMEAYLPNTEIIHKSNTIDIDLDCEPDDGCQSVHGSNATPLVFVVGLLGWRRRRPA